MYLSSTHLVFIIFFAASGLFMWSQMRARESATRWAKIACRQHNVQFLDGSVVLRKTGLVRGASGALVFAREFEFEFSVEGTERRKGMIRMRAHRQQYVWMDLPKNPEITLGHL